MDSKELLHEIRADIKEINKNISEIRILDVEQNAQLTDRQADFMELDTDQEFSLNLCSLVVDQLERRMSVSGFDAPGDLGGKDGALWTWWKKEKMDARQSAVHLSAVRDGDTYVIVSWDQELGRPRFSPNMAFDGTASDDDDGPALTPAAYLPDLIGGRGIAARICWD